MIKVADPKEKLYIAGPVTGIANRNEAMFTRAEQMLQREGHETVNPLTVMPDDEDLPWVDAMLKDIPPMIQCDGMAILPGPWYNSSGVKLELHIMIALKKSIYHFQEIDGELQLFPGPPSDYGSAIAEAQSLVYGNRGAAYGHPYEDYTKTAAFMSVILGMEVTPEKAILCMIAVKLSREIHQSKRDNRVDMIGYAECLQRCYNLNEDEKQRITEGVYGGADKA